MAFGPVSHPTYKDPSAGTPVCGWRLEKAARKRGALRIAGLDEVGRGPLFGPVVAAAVILQRGCHLEDLNDSKKLSEKKRNELEPEIRANAIAWAIAVVDAETIDRINIRQASLLAMRLAVPAAGSHPGRCHQLFHRSSKRAGQGPPRPPVG